MRGQEGNFRHTRRRSALPVGLSPCTELGPGFQAPFSSFAAGIASKMRRTWHSGHVKTDAPLRSCLLYVANAYAEWGPHP